MLCGQFTSRSSQHVVLAKALNRQLELGHSHIDKKPEDAKWGNVKKSWTIFTNRIKVSTQQFNKELDTNVKSMMDKTISDATIAIKKEPLAQIAAILKKSPEDASKGLQELIKTGEVAKILSQHTQVMMFYRVAAIATSISKAMQHRNS